MQIRLAKNTLQKQKKPRLDQISVEDYVGDDVGEKKRKKEKKKKRKKEKKRDQITIDCIGDFHPYTIKTDQSSIV